MKKSDYPIFFGHRTDGDCVIELQMNPVTTPSLPHWHDTYEVAYQLSGKRVYDYSGEQYVLHAGDVLIIPPHTMHGTPFPDSEFKAYVFGYSPNIIYSHDISFRNMRYLLAFSGEHSFERCRFSGDSPEMDELRAEIIQLAGYGNSPVSELIVRASILCIHDKIYRLYNRGKNQNTSEFLEAVQSYIDDHILEDISPYNIADFLHISHSLLCHKLQEELGCTPNELIMRCKLNLAENLLLDRRGLSVTEVGLEIGIPDTSYFIKCFKNSRGVTPGQFRRLTRDMRNEKKQ